VVEIVKGAFFVADTHTPHYSTLFDEMLDAIIEGRLSLPQLFLMGDIFDLLFAKNRLIYEYNKSNIKRLQRVSEVTSVYYIEGNHDFYLQPLFPNIKIVPFNKQPLMAKYKNSYIYLSHGDKIDTTPGYRLYTTILRSPITLWLLKPFGRYIINRSINYLKSKKICTRIKGFENIISKREKLYPKDAKWIVEGHLHQGKIINKYVSLPAFACSNKIAIFDGDGFEFVDINTLLDKR